jgi:hypothetical protein
MENSQAVAYIRKHLENGHTEAAVRKQFLSSGWSQSAVDEAFRQYRQAEKPKTKKAKARRAVKRARKHSYRRKSQRSRKGLFVVAIVVVLAIIGLVLFLHRAPKAVVPPPVPKTTAAQLRQSDVDILAGAIGQFTASNDGVVPTGISLAANGTNLVLCGATCDPTTGTVASLSSYLPSNVQFTTYAPSLSVPSEQIMYVVPQAACAPHGAGIGGPSTNKRAMIILYGTLSGSVLTQRCTGL